MSTALKNSTQNLHKKINNISGFFLCHTIKKKVGLNLVGVVFHLVASSFKICSFLIQRQKKVINIL